MKWKNKIFKLVALMAIANLSVRVGNKGKGKAHASYILRQDKYASHAEKKEKLVAIGHGNMPSWATDNPLEFWEMADVHERKNGTTYREHIVALPRELDEQQLTNLSKLWIEKVVGKEHPYSFAIHSPKALDGGEQPHLHFMFCERVLDEHERTADQFFKRYNSKNPDRGGAKKASISQTWTSRKEALKAIRHDWEIVCNRFLENADFDIRIDMRNWEERGLKAKPINISKEEFLDPLVKQAYKEKLIVKREISEFEEQEFEQAESRIISSQQVIDRAIGTNDYSKSELATIPRPNERRERVIEQAESRIISSQQVIDRAIGTNDYSKSELATIPRRIGQRERVIERANQIIDEREQLKNSFESQAYSYINEHFLMLRGVGIEANPAVENYSLYRAVTAQKTLLDSAKIGDRQTFLETFEQYRNAMYGTPVPRFSTESNENRYKREQNEKGEMGFIAKLRQIGFDPYKYDPDNAQHQLCKQNGLNIARTLNQRTESIVQTAYQNRLINDNDKILGAVAGYKTYETMPEIIEMINSSLEFHQDKVNEFSMRYQAISQATFKPKI